MSVTGTPMVSVVVSNWNSRDLIDKCVDSLLRTNYDRLEVIVVDDASTDGGPELVREKYGQDVRLTVLVNGMNEGLTKVFNRGYAQSRGDYVVLAHGDTYYVDPDWLRRFVEVMESDPLIGVAQGKILSVDVPQVILSVGRTIDYLGFPQAVKGEQEEDRGQYDQSCDIFECWDACMIVRRSLGDSIGLFDPAYFFCFEEEDFCWRTWLAGYRVAYAPGVKVWHRSGNVAASLPIVLLYHLSKNWLATLFKNYGPWNFVRFVPVAFALAVIRGVSEWLFVDSKRGGAILRSVWWVCTHLGPLWSSRRRVQRLRRVPDSVPMKLMVRPRFSVYAKRLTLHRNRRHQLSLASRQEERLR